MDLQYRGRRYHACGSTYPDEIVHGPSATSTITTIAIEKTYPPLVRHSRRFLDAGAYMIMLESEGITENVPQMRTGIPARYIDELDLKKLMFEAADPEVFAWYVKNYGPEVNLFVDHNQIVQLERLRSGIWRIKDLFGRVHTYKDGSS